MKKMMCATVLVVLLALLVSSFGACGNNLDRTIGGEISVCGNQPQSAREPELNSTQSGEPETKALCGYTYCFPAPASQKSFTFGTVFECNDCNVFAFTQNYLEFESWETVVSDCQDYFFCAVGSPFQFYPSSQNIKESQLIKNQNGIELYRVEGTLNISSGNREFVAFYHLTDHNKVRFFAGLNDQNDLALISETVDFMAAHLAIDEHETR